MKKIGLDSVCKQIYRRNAVELDQAFERDWDILRYPFKKFKGDAFADDFISTRITLTAKWDALIASGIVVERGEDTFIDVPVMKESLERMVCI